MEQQQKPDLWKQLKKISDTAWEIPQSFKQGMRVPARIIGTEKLVKEMDPGVYDQVTNVATLPGIQKYALCMPDGHWGYGFPIGGVAAFDAEEGVISPGGVGFDINCVHPDTNILTKEGYYRKIKEFNNRCNQERVAGMDSLSQSKKYSQPLLLLKKLNDKKTFKLQTEFGHELILTEDHPVLTEKGYKSSAQLNQGDRIFLHPFRGVPYESPSTKVIIDESDILKIAPGRKGILSTLNSKGLIPLTFDNPKLPILTKILGYLTGDGWMGGYFNKKRKQKVWSMRFIGAKEDLEEIRGDIETLGFTASYIATNHCKSTITQSDGVRRIVDGHSTQYHVNSQALAILMKALGMPEGNKSKTETKVPGWLWVSPLWIKRLYLAGFFGAELSGPVQRKGEPYSFTEPSVSQNKILSLQKGLRAFIREIAELLIEFGVKTNNIYQQKGAINKEGETTGKQSLRISSNIENLMRLWGRIGFEYCKKRKGSSILALAYLLKKRAFLQNKLSKIQEEIVPCSITRGTELLQVQKYALNRVRITKDFPTFEEFAHESGAGSEMVKDKIVSIDEIDYGGDVLDFTMDDRDHNFLANGIVTHNCGMRLVTTNLTYKEVQPKIKQLVDTLFQRVPAGVGSTGFVKLTHSEFKEVISDGAKWAVEKGYGWEEDLKKTEEDGCIQDADASKVTDKAIKRGFNQIGTLGSGNHYLEIQRVLPENIIDEETAKAWGIFPDQIVVMFHCGSRGFGHQVATDSLIKFLNVMESKYQIKILDRELACAPFQSPEGQEYFKAMKCGINMSFANRQVILHRIREVFSEIFKKSPEELEIKQVYDVAHNTAKLEEYTIDGKKKKLIVHRKGATRSFGPGHSELIPIYEKYGQPVIIGGSMETGSYLLAGTKKAEEETFGSTAHGSGRTMSRNQAKHQWRGEQLQRDMEKRGIYVRTTTFSGLAEEAGGAYKDVDAVIMAAEEAGISRRVVKLVPMGNVKG